MSGSASWLVRDATPPPSTADLRVWLPAALTAHARFAGDDAAEIAARLSYIVVDEIVDDAIGLTISTWPYADADGRLRFLRGDDRIELGVSRRVLRQMYSEERVGTMRVGDVFAAQLTPRAAQVLADRGEDDPVWGESLDGLLDGAVYDLTQAARTVSKLAYYGAMSIVLSESEAAADDLDELADRSEVAAPVRQLPRRSPPLDGGPGAGR